MISEAKFKPAFKAESFTSEVTCFTGAELKISFMTGHTFLKIFPKKFPNPAPD